MVKRYYSFGEIFAALVITIVVAVTAYRLAVIFDWIPEDFRPSEIALHEYKEFKAVLAKNVMEPGLVGTMSKATLNTFKRIEAYMQQKEEAERLEASLPEECRHGSVYRFFMFLDDPNEKNPNCTRQNLQIQNALEDAGVTKKKNKNKDVAPQPEQTQVAPVVPTQEQQMQELQQQIKQYEPTTPISTEPQPATTP